MSTAPETIKRILALLTPLQADDRQRVMNSVRAYFDDPLPHPATVGGASTVEGAQNQHSDVGQVPSKAASWLRMNELTRDQLDDVFHFDEGKIDLIADVPGRSKKEKTFNVYVLAGTANLVATGSAHFDDETARQMCERASCYDQANHAANIKDIGGIVSGDKKGGWTLTQPGMKRAAALVKEILAPAK